MSQILAVKLSLPIRPDYEIADETLSEFINAITHLGCEETMVNSWSWGLFTVQASDPADLVPELQELAHQIKSIAVEFGIYQAETDLQPTTVIN